MGILKSEGAAVQEMGSIKSGALPQREIGILKSEGAAATRDRSEEHTSELQSRETISYAVFCLKKKITNNNLTILLMSLFYMYISMLLLDTSSSTYYYLSLFNLLFTSSPQ